MATLSSGAPTDAYYEDFPVTVQVRNAYRNSIWTHERGTLTWDQVGAQFDRWLAEHDAEVAEALTTRLHAAQAALADEVDWWYGVGEVHGPGIMLLREASLRRLKHAITPTAHIASLLEQSSLGTPEAQALRASVSDERAAEILRMAGITASVDCTCFPTDPKTWTRYGSAVEPGSTLEPDPDCPVHFPSGGELQR